MLPEQDATAFPSASQVAQDGKCELLQRRLGIDDTLETGYDPRLRSFLLARFVQPAQVVARLEYMVAHFLYYSVSSFLIPVNNRANFTVLYGPELCSSKIFTRISIAFAFCRTSSSVALMDKCLTAFNMCTKNSGSSSSHARSRPRIMLASHIGAQSEVTYVEQPSLYPARCEHEYPTAKLDRRPTQFELSSCSSPQQHPLGLS